MKHWFIERSPKLGEKAIQTELHYIKGAIKLICRTSVVQQSAVSPHQGYRQLLEQSQDGRPFFLPILAGKSTSQFPNLNYGTLVPGTQAFHGDWNKLNSLAVASFPGLVQLNI